MAGKAYKQATAPTTAQGVTLGDLWIAPGAPDTVYVCSDLQPGAPVWILFAEATVTYEPVAGVATITGTAGEIDADEAAGDVTLSLPAALVAPGSLTVTTRTGTPATFACFDTNGKLCEGDPVT